MKMCGIFLTPASSISQLPSIPSGNFLTLLHAEFRARLRLWGRVISDSVTCLARVGKFPGVRKEKGPRENRAEPHERDHDGNIHFDDPLTVSTDEALTLKDHGRQHLSECCRASHGCSCPAAVRLRRPSLSSPRSRLPVCRNTASGAFRRGRPVSEDRGR